MDSDSYLTLQGPAEARFTEKMSRFLAFAAPAETIDEAKSFVNDIQRRYHDARHVCWAWVIGSTETQTYCNDNGEPSGTAGKPILGQINSAGLRNVVIAVVRYFGGIKLGTPGLIAAYRESARLAIAEGTIIERQMEDAVEFTFPYQSMNSVMALAKLPEVTVASRQFDNTCRMTLSTRRGFMPELRARLAQIPGLSIL